MSDEVVTPEVTVPEIPVVATPEAPPTVSPVPEGSFYSGAVPKELEGPYKEMQASFTRQQQALSRERMELRKPLATSPQPTTPEAGEPDAFAGQIGAMEGQMREIRLELMNTQIDRFAEGHKDVYDHAAEMADHMLKVPGLSMEQAYWMVKGPKAEQQGMRKAMTILQTKAEQPQGGPVGQANLSVPKKVPETLAEMAKEAYNAEVLKNQK